MLPLSPLLNTLKSLTFYLFDACVYVLIVDQYIPTILAKIIHGHRRIRIQLDQAFLIVGVLSKHSRLIITTRTTILHL